MYVTGQLIADGSVLIPRLKFLVDTAAQQTFVGLRDEVHLRTVYPNLEFHRDVLPVGTMLGSAPVKALKDHGGGLGIRFVDVNNNYVNLTVPFVYFGDENQRVVPRWVRSVQRYCKTKARLWDRVGQGLDHSILGLDVLSQTSLIYVPHEDYGFLTTLPSDKLVDHLEDPQSPVSGGRAYYDRMRGDINWED